MIHVAVAAVVNTRDEVLLAQRPSDKHLGGYWEFPGGKVEAEEAVVDALRRELEEEVALAPTTLRPLIRIHHAYPEKSVLLDVWRVDQVAGTAHGREGQPLAWVPVAELGNWKLPPADRSIVTALSLPDRYLITPEVAGQPDRFLDRLGCALADGVALVQLRGVAVAQRDLETLRAAAAMCRKAGVRVLSSSRHYAALAEVVDGINLTSQDLWRSRVEAVRYRGLACASCHTERDIQRAGDLGVDFITLSPVALTRSHPDATPLGWPRFAALAERATMPVYALGGMGDVDVAMAWQHGAQGIAAIGALWPDA